MQRQLLLVAILILGSTAPTANLVAQLNPPQAAHPNVVLILMDDLGYGDLAATVGRMLVRPTSTDSREGVRLT
jgi:hypothetical protein